MDMVGIWRRYLDGYGPTHIFHQSEKVVFQACGQDATCVNGMVGRVHDACDFSKTESSWVSACTPPK